MAAFAAAPEMNWSPVAIRPRCTRCAPIALPAVRASSADSTASGANTVGAPGSPMHTQPRTKPMGAASKSCCTSPSATTISPTARPLASPPAMPVLMTAPGANRSMSTCVQRAALTLPMPHRTLHGLLRGLRERRDEGGELRIHGADDADPVIRHGDLSFRKRDRGRAGFCPP